MAATTKKEIKDIVKQGIIKRLRPELRELLSSKGNVTKAFCKKFYELLPDEKEFEENTGEVYGGGDSTDYISWGYALFGEWEEAETETNILNVWDLIEKWNIIK